MDNTKIITLSEGTQVEVITKMNWRLYRSIKASMAGSATLDSKTRQTKLSDEGLIHAQDSLIKNLVVKITKKITGAPEGMPTEEVITDKVQILAFLDETDMADGEKVYAFLEDLFNSAETGNIDQKKD